MKNKGQDDRARFIIQNLKSAFIVVRGCSLYDCSLIRGIESNPREPFVCNNHLICKSYYFERGLENSHILDLYKGKILDTYPSIGDRYSKAQREYHFNCCQAYLRRGK